MSTRHYLVILRRRGERMDTQGVPEPEVGGQASAVMAMKVRWDTRLEWDESPARILIRSTSRLFRLVKTTPPPHNNGHMLLLPASRTARAGCLISQLAAGCQCADYR